ncbi:MAG: hypothetical protein ACJ76H_09320, partial [Bacteriovoracaceae bacterium]
IFDLLGGYIFSTGDSTMSLGGNGNAKGRNDVELLGGPQAFLGFEVGQKHTDMQYAFKALYSRTFKSESRFQDQATDTNDPYNSWLFQGSLLNNLSDNKLFLRTLASVQFVSIQNSKDAEGFKSDVAPLTIYNLGTGPEYALSQDLLVNARVDYSNYVFDTGSIDHYYTWIWTVGAKYQF